MPQRTHAPTTRRPSFSLRFPRLAGAVSRLKSPVLPMACRTPCPVRFSWDLVPPTLSPRLYQSGSPFSLPQPSLSLPSDLCDSHATAFSLEARKARPQTGDAGSYSGAPKLRPGPSR
eukprot:3380281-Rhodomonas_salina.3